MLKFPSVFLAGFAFLATLLLAISCSDEPLIDYPVDFASTNVLTVRLAEASKGIDWISLKVILVRLRLTDPRGGVHSVDCVPGASETVTFTTGLFGDHLLEAIEFATNTNGVTNSVTNSALIEVEPGFNYIVTVTVGGNIIIDINTNTNTNGGTNTNGNTNTNTNTNGGTGVFSLYSDTFPPTVLWDTDTKMDIWFDPENNIPLTLTVTDQTGSTGEGAQAWKINGLSPTIYWIGMGIRVQPTNSFRDLREYTNGALHFRFRGTRAFKVGLKDGNDIQQWIKPIQMSFYGLRTNDTWCEILIPLKKFDQIDFSRIQQYFMWTADTTMGYTTNRTYYLDDIYFTNGYGGAFDGYVETNFGIYSESVEQSVNMNYDTELSIWTDYNAGMVLQDDPSDVAEGTRSWKLTGTGDWMGFGIYAWPGNATRDMSAYLNGSLRFSYKGTKPVTKIGTQSRNPDNSLQDALATGYDLMTYFGLKTNNTWGEVVIPVRYLVWRGLDLSRVFHYFLFAQDQSTGYAVGDVCRLDNIYWTKTPGGNTNWTTNTNITGFGIYSETVPLGVSWDVDVKMYIWTDWGGGMTVQEIFGGAGEAFNSWKLTGTGAWMGMGITVYPNDAMKNMTAYASGHLNFLFKGTKKFNKIGVASEPCGNTIAWFTADQLVPYGLKTDGTWSRVSIPVSAITAKGVKLAELKSYFMFVHDSVSGYAAGDTFWLDNIYYSKN